MKEFYVARLKHGMILSEPVFDFHGLLLLKKGSKLSKKNISMLKSWGVVSVIIDGEFEDDDNQLYGVDIKLNEKINNELKEKFSEVLNNPVMDEIKRAACRLLVKKAVDNEQRE